MPHYEPLVPDKEAESRPRPRDSNRWHPCRRLVRSAYEVGLGQFRYLPSWRPLYIIQGRLAELSDLYPVFTTSEMNPGLAVSLHGHGAESWLPQAALFEATQRSNSACAVSVGLQDYPTQRGSSERNRKEFSRQVGYWKCWCSSENLTASNEKRWKAERTFIPSEAELAAKIANHANPPVTLALRKLY